MGIIFRVALQNLIASKRRSLFLGTALMFVTLLYVVLLAVTAGVTDNLVRVATNLPSGHINIAGFYKSSPTDAQTLVTGTAALKADARRILPEAVRVVDRLRGWGKIVSERGSIQSGLTGIDPDEETSLLSILALAPARDYQENPKDPAATPGDMLDLKQPRSLMLFAAQAKRLKVGVGDQVTLRSETLKGQSNTVEVTIVAVAKDLGVLSSFAVFASKETVQTLYQLRPDVTGVIQVRLPDPEQSTAAMERLRQGLKDAGHELLNHEAQPFFVKLLQVIPQEDWTGARLDVTTWQDEASVLNDVIAALRAVSFFLVMLLAVVIVIGITNTMTIAVRERTREIGTLRAIGMTRSRVSWLFLTEALLLGLLSTVLGGVLGSLLCVAIDHAHIELGIDAMRVILLSDTLHLVVRPSDVLLAVATLTVVAAAAALLPSLRAARITPVSAMASAD